MRTKMQGWCSGDAIQQPRAEIKRSAKMVGLDVGVMANRVGEGIFAVLLSWIGTLEGALQLLGQRSELGKMKDGGAV